MASLLVPVILCGGSGTRLWPASRENRPKQFLRLMDERSLLQNTLARALRLSGVAAERVMTVTVAALADAAAAQMAAIAPAATRHVLREPVARNTAAAVAYAALCVERASGRDAVMLVLAADHHVGDEAALDAAVAAAVAAAQKGALVTFGIRATRAETGYGYIRCGDALDGAAYTVAAFYEKPDVKTAQGYVDSGDYLWNSGMFLFRAGDILDAFAQYAPEVLEAVRAALGADDTVDAALYAAVPSLSFEKTIMEKSAKVAVVPCDPRWSDLGTWENLWEQREKDADGNAVMGDVATHRTKDCLIVSSGGRLVTGVGVSNLAIVDTGDAVLVANLRDSDALRALVQDLKARGRTEAARIVEENVKGSAL